MQRVIQGTVEGKSILHGSLFTCLRCKKQVFVQDAHEEDLCYTPLPEGWNSINNGMLTAPYCEVCYGEYQALMKEFMNH